MKIVMRWNAVIAVSWIVATVCLILNGHEIWAIFTFIGAFFSGYSLSTKETP